MPDPHPAFLAALDRELAGYHPGFITITDRHGAALASHLRAVRRCLDSAIRARRVDANQLDDGSMEVEILGDPEQVKTFGPGIQSALRRAGFVLRKGRAPNVALVYPDGWSG